MGANDHIKTFYPGVGEELPVAVNGSTPEVVYRGNKTTGFVKAWKFDPDGSDYLDFAFRVPSGTGAFDAGTVNISILYSASVVTGDVRFETQLKSITPGASADDLDTKAYADAVGANSTVPGIAGVTKAVTLAHDGTANQNMAVGDLLMVRVKRAGSKTADTANGPIYVHSITLIDDA